MGRPSKFSVPLIDEIVSRLSQGEPLAKICRDDHMPHPSTVRDWMAAREDISLAIGRAREDGFDAIALEALEIADFGERDTMEAEDGREITNHDVIQRSKLRVETRLKLLSKWDPKRYGDRQVLAGDPDAPLTGMTKDQIDARLRELGVDPGSLGNG